MLNGEDIMKDFYKVESNETKSMITIDETAFGYGLNKLKISFKANNDYIESTISIGVYREDPNFLYYFNPDSIFIEGSSPNKLKFAKSIGWKSSFSDGQLPDNWWFANFNHYGLFRYYEKDLIKCSFHNIIAADFNNEEAYQLFLSSIYQYNGDVKIFVISYNDYSVDQCKSKLKAVLENVEYL